jgi:hypothetical protein
MAKTRFHALLDSKLQEVLDDRSREIAAGSARDYSQYQFMVGYLAGMRDSLKYAAEIEEDFDR